MMALKKTKVLPDIQPRLDDLIAVPSGKEDFYQHIRFPGRHPVGKRIYGGQGQLQHGGRLPCVVQRQAEKSTRAHCQEVGGIYPDVHPLLAAKRGGLHCEPQRKLLPVSQEHPLGMF